MSKRIALVVDDTPANRDFVERLMVQADFEVRGASSFAEAIQQVDGLEQLALALVDIQLPDSSGLQLTQELRRKYPDAYLVVATMYDQRSLVEQVFTIGGNVYLVKPHGFMELFKRLTTSTIEALREEGNIIIDQYGPRTI